MFDAQPHLAGELVELRPLRESDFQDLYAVAADPAIWEQHPDPTRFQEDVFRAFFSEHIASGGALLVLDRRTQAAIGTSRFHGYDPDRSEIEIGWTFLGRSYWGGAYNGELKSLMLAHAFRFVRNVVFLVSPANLRSQRAVEKIGGVRVGSRPDAGGRESIVYRVNVVKRSRRLAVPPSSLPLPTRRPVDASQQQVRARSHLVDHLGHRCPVRVGGRAVEIAAAEVGRLHGSRKLATRFVRRPR